jgi:hypothetical protein
VKTIFTSAWEKIKSILPTAFEWIKNALTSVWEWIKNLFLNYHPYGLIIKHWDSITAFFVQLWEKVKTIFSTSWEKIKSILPTAFEWMRSALTSVYKKIQTGVTGFLNSIRGRFIRIVETLRGLPGEFVTLGKAMIQGLIDGVKNMSGALWETIKELVNGILNKFKIPLQIHSPSIIFRNLGGNITEGLTRGIELGTPAVGRTSGEMAVKVITAYGQSLELHSRPVPEVGADREPLLIRLQKIATEPEGNSSIIPASKIFHSQYLEGARPVEFNQHITFSGNMNETDKHDFAKRLKEHAKEVIDIIRKDDDNHRRLRFF